MIAEATALVAERLGADGGAVLARLGGPFGHAARQAAATLARLDADGRKRRRAEVRVLARSPLPEGLRAVHPTWIEAALAALPARARAAVATVPRDPVDVWLARSVTATIPPIAKDARDAVAWLVSVGSDQIAFALGAAAARARALAAAAARIVKHPRVGQLGPQRAAIDRCRDVSLDDELAFVIVASRALAPHLAADQLGLLQLTRRLPRPIASVVESEVHAHAATSFDQCPTWTALLAE